MERILIDFEHEFFYSILESLKKEKEYNNSDENVLYSIANDISCSDIAMTIDDLKHDKSLQLEGKYFLNGSIGLWHGRYNACTDISELEKMPLYEFIQETYKKYASTGDYDIQVKITDDKEILFTMSHHDGTHYMYVSKLKRNNFSYETLDKIDYAFSFNDMETIERYTKTVTVK